MVIELEEVFATRGVPMCAAEVQQPGADFLSTATVLRGKVGLSYIPDNNG